MDNTYSTMRLNLLAISVFVFCFCPGRLGAQSSTFDFDNESWTTKGDPTTSTATWVPTGGLTGGWAQMIDASTGGTCYFVSPNIFRGNLLGAYQCDLEYDLMSSDNSNPNMMPQLELFGAGLKLVYSSPYVPGLSWTHFIVPMKEDAGWFLNNLTSGNAPTKEQFRAVLSDVTEFNIRGEFYSNGPDEAGLDNVYFNGLFDFDLDANNSSGATNGNFKMDSTCFPYGQIADIDASLFCENAVERIEIYIQNAKADDNLVVDAFPGTIDVKTISPDTVHLIAGAQATQNDFILAILNMHYQDNAPKPRRAVRVIVFNLYNECGGLVATRYAYLPIFPPATAGLDGDTLLCSNSAALDLYEVLNGLPDPSGYWEPPFVNVDGLFHPGIDSAGKYAYIIPKSGECVGDTAFVTVKVEYPFELGPDSTLCYDESWRILRPKALLDWTWSTGSKLANLVISEPGIYGITGSTENCTFSDSLRADFYTCRDCDVYAPNVFSPNDDGENDRWKLYLRCPWLQFHLEVYDRWGSLVFESFNPDTEWDGFIKSRAGIPGVYAWQAHLSSEYYGQPKSYFLKGDVTILR